MRVCFSVGPMSSKLISSISKSADNVEFSTYTTISDMIKESTMRHIFFDRIVFSEKILNDSESELRALNDYITEFSDNTKVVFICQGKNMANTKIFSNLFDSPLYTVVLVEKVTTNILLEFVKGDITELKAKYYSLDVKETRVVTSKHKEIPVQSGVSENVNSEKKGFFKSIFGGKKKKSSKVENQNSPVDTSSDEGNTANSVAQNVVENVAPIGMSGGAMLGGMESVGVSAKIGADVIRNNSDVGRGSVGASDLGSQNFYNSFDEDNLGIGDLGEQHVDTGFLDDSAEFEIEKALQRMEDDVDYVEEDAPILDGYNIETEDTYISNMTPKLEDFSYSRDSSSKFRLVIGERGIGATSSIIDFSVENCSLGKKVLILDLDTVDNGVLSYIDSDRYYRKGKENGISKLSVYSEDGVDILSNGYGRGIGSKEIGILLGSGLFDKYDLVFIDCPVDCLSNLSKDLVSECSVSLRVGGNRGSLLGFLNKLTSRESLSAEVEDMLYEVSQFEVCNKIGYYKEDLSFLRKLCFFSREDWLLKIT